MSERLAIVPRRGRQAIGGIRRFFDTGNLFRFLLSIVLAFGLWALVTYQNDPETTRVIGGLPVTIQNLESEMELVGDPPTVDVTIQGPQSVVTPLERDNVVASVDLEGIDDAGEHELDVSVNAPSDVRVREVSPDPVNIEID
jgi:YbbR domain-containing protein